VLRVVVGGARRWRQCGRRARSTRDTQATQRDAGLRTSLYFTGLGSLAARAAAGWLACLPASMPPRRKGQRLRGGVWWHSSCVEHFATCWLAGARARELALSTCSLAGLRFGAKRLSAIHRCVVSNTKAATNTNNKRQRDRYEEVALLRPIDQTLIEGFSRVE